MPKSVFIYQHRYWGKIFSACPHPLSHMQGESTAVLHYIASNTSFCSKVPQFPHNYPSRVFLFIVFFKEIIKFSSERLLWCCRLGPFCFIALLHNVWEEIPPTKQGVRWSGGPAIPPYVVEPLNTVLMQGKKTPDVLSGFSWSRKRNSELWWSLPGANCPSSWGCPCERPSSCSHCLNLVVPVDAGRRCSLANVHFAWRGKKRKKERTLWIWRSKPLFKGFVHFVSRACDLVSCSR